MLAKNITAPPRITVPDNESHFHIQVNMIQYKTIGQYEIIIIIIITQEFICHGVLEKTSPPIALFFMKLPAITIL